MKYPYVIQRADAIRFTSAGTTSMFQTDMEFGDTVAIQHLVARYPVLSSLSVPVRNHPECCYEHFLHWCTSTQQRDSLQINA
ncbi:hypothetical protein WJX79_009989 [Trebouxia sp. C0005]